MKKNIARVIIEYYDSDDFKSDYVQVLCDNMEESRDECIGRICRYFSVDKKMAEEIYAEIYENIEQYIDTYRNYYVGPDCLESVSFGEQEEQIFRLVNHATGKPYNKKYIRDIFEREGFTVVNECAYYYLCSDGIYIDLSKYTIKNK